MRKLALLIFAIIVALGAVPAPAGASVRGPTRGSLDVQFNMGVIFGAGVAADPDTNVAYIGDISFPGHDYTLVWFNLVPPEAGCTVCHAEEIWRIYDSAEYEFGVVDIPGVGPVPGVLTSFVPGDLVLAGTDRAIGTSSGYWVGWGPVTDVGPAASGPFDQSTGGRVFWSGSYDTDEVGPYTHFMGRFYVFPRFGR